MARKASDLAARLRAAVEREGEDRSDEEEARLSRLEVGAVARSDLFDELEAFGGETGFLKVERGEGVTFRFGDRFLSFWPSGEGDSVRVEFSLQEDNADHRLYREAALGDRWVWVRRRRKSEDRLPLFEQGLELLLVHALELPDPNDGVSGGESEPPPAPAPAPAPAAASSDEVGPPEGPRGKKRSL